MMNPLVMDLSTVDITNKMVDDRYRLLEAQEAIQEFANNLKCDKWEGKLPFISSPITAYFEGGMEFHQNENLLLFCLPQYKGLKIYFNPCVYPSPLIDGSNNGFEQLRIELERAAHNNGYKLCCNGGNKTNRVFLCQCSRKYRLPTHHEKDALYRSTSLHNDRENSRGADGRTLSRRTKSVLPQSSDNTCKFRFTVEWDVDGIFFLCGIGNAEHNNHCRIQAAEMCFPARLLQGAHREILKDLGGSYANCGVGRNFVFKKEGLYFSRSQVRYLYRDDEFIYNQHATDAHVTAPGSLLKIVKF